MSPDRLGGPYAIYVGSLFMFAGVMVITFSGSFLACLSRAYSRFNWDKSTILKELLRVKPASNTGPEVSSPFDLDRMLLSCIIAS